MLNVSTSRGYSSVFKSFSVADNLTKFYSDFIALHNCQICFGEDSKIFIFIWWILVSRSQLGWIFGTANFISKLLKIWKIQNIPWKIQMDELKNSWKKFCLDTKKIQHNRCFSVNNLIKTHLFDPYLLIQMKIINWLDHFSTHTLVTLLFFLIKFKLLKPNHSYKNK